MRDGMNLVAKEYIAAQDREDPGVLILSRFAGAADECREALLVNPYDPDAVAAAIARAMAMSLGERKARHKELYAALLRNDVSKWGDKFLKALSPSDKRGPEVVHEYLAESVKVSAATGPADPPATRQ
jgi:trehalose 6-phosphate synthase